MQVAAEAACIGTITIATIAITRNTFTVPLHRAFGSAPSLPFEPPQVRPGWPRSGQPLADCTLGMCPFAGIGRDIPRMVDGITVRPAVQRTADRRIKREADQASAG